MIARRYVLLPAIVACVLTLFSVQRAVASQPYLGFDGTLVDVPARFGFDGRIKGMRVNWVKRGAPAARMGLERGDIILTIDNIAFRSHAGYLAALRMSSQRPGLMIINVRNGRLTRVNCSLPHTRDTREHRDTMGLAIDLIEDMRGH